MNTRIASIPPSASLAVAAKAGKLKAEGRTIYSFGAGEPDFDTPEHIKQAAIAALQKGETKYAPNAGIPALRKAICEKFKRDNGLAYEPDQVLVSNGAKHSIYNIIAALCNEGDEVIIPAPFWLSYPEMARIVGAVPVFVHGREDRDFKITPAELEKVVTPRSRVLVMNSPSNPIGIVYTEAELRAIAAVAVKHDLWIIADEIYEKIVYDGATHASIASFNAETYAKTITVNGFSKAYSMTGWRLGYLAGPKPLVKAMDALQSHSTSGPNTFAMFGAVAGLLGDDSFIKKMVDAFTERRAYLYQRLTSIPGVTCVKPMGAFYMLPNVSSFGLDSVKFSELLLEREGVAVVPGEAFGCDANIRLSYACSMANIEKGADGLERFVKSL
ncbi:MAG: pyridoxal phosphate-dependent aminotransferase [Verrucomicrobia bacterium]|nr:pyridoxal phosphate-dependent aminotransferase [Verrucomicrobiota bacterium]